MKTAIFCTCGSKNWETVADRWVHAARGLASTELSFHPCNILRDSRRGVSLGETKMWAVVRENGDFITVVNYTIFAAIIDSFMSNSPSVAYVRELLVYVF